MFIHILERAAALLSFFQTIIFIIIITNKTSGFIITTSFYRVFNTGTPMSSIDILFFCHLSFFHCHLHLPWFFPRPQKTSSILVQAAVWLRIFLASVTDTTTISCFAPQGTCFTLILVNFLAMHRWSGVSKGERNQISRHFTPRYFDIHLIKQRSLA